MRAASGSQLISKAQVQASNSITPCPAPEHSAAACPCVLVPPALTSGRCRGSGCLPACRGSMQPAQTLSSLQPWPMTSLVGCWLGPLSLYMGGSQSQGQVEGPLPPFSSLAHSWACPIQPAYACC